MFTANVVHIRIKSLTDAVSDEAIRILICHIFSHMEDRNSPNVIQFVSFYSTLEAVRQKVKALHNH